MYASVPIYSAEDMVNVIKSFLPPVEEYQAMLKRAWVKGWIIYRGEVV